MAQLYLDCDGVLADFVSYTREHVFGGLKPPEWENIHGADKFWGAIKSHDRLYYKLPFMADAMELYDAVKHLDPIILTGCHEGDYGREDKEQWVLEKFGASQRIITCESKHKAVYCKPGDVIVDDWPRHRPVWEAAGGIWVHHENAKQSITELQQLGIL